jgi:hypothetical protein
MLTKLLIRDKTTASLGKTEHTITVHVSGEIINMREFIRQHYPASGDENSRKAVIFHRIGLVNDHLVEGLDGGPTSHSATSLIFPKLIPLAGG